MKDIRLFVEAEMDFSLGDAWKMNSLYMLILEVVKIL